MELALIVSAKKAKQLTRLLVSYQWQKATGARYKPNFVRGELKGYRLEYRGLYYDWTPVQEDQVAEIERLGVGYPTL